MLTERGILKDIRPIVVIRDFTKIDAIIDLGEDTISVEFRDNDIHLLDNFSKNDLVEISYKRFVSISKQQVCHNNILAVKISKI